MVAASTARSSIPNSAAEIGRQKISRHRDGRAALMTTSPQQGFFLGGPVGEGAIVHTVFARFLRRLTQTSPEL
jgi:hypothetical protein